MNGIKPGTGHCEDCQEWVPVKDGKLIEHTAHAPARKCKGSGQPVDKDGEAAPRLFEQWDGRGRPEQWELLQRVGESTTWAGCRYDMLPRSVKKVIDPILQQEHAGAVGEWEKRR